MTPNATTMEEPTSTTTTTLSATTTTPSSHTTTSTSTSTPRLSPTTPEDPSPCCSETAPSPPEQQQQTRSPALSSSTSSSTLRHPHVGSKMGYAILAIILILGWVTVMALLIFKEMWQLVLLGWLLFYAAAHFCYWFYKRNTSITLQQQLRLRLVSHFRSPGSPFKPNDHPPAYDDVMKSEPPPPSYFSVISEIPSCSSDPPPAYPSPARPIASTRRNKKFLPRIPSAAGSISAVPPPVEVEAHKVLVAARPSSSSSSSSTATAISYLSTNSSSPVAVPVHSHVQRSVSQFCDGDDGVTSEARHVGTTGTDDVIVHISSSTAEDDVENDESTSSRREEVPPQPQGSAPSSPSFPHRGGEGGGGEGDATGSATSNTSPTSSDDDAVIRISSECITLEEYELKNSSNDQVLPNGLSSDSTDPDHRSLESTSESATEVTENYSESQSQPACVT